MNKQLFDSLDRIDEALLNIDVKVKAIHEKLDELIKALHAYDDDQLEWPEPNDALKEAAAQYNEKVAPCKGHDAASWEHEAELNKRMDVIGQNGNTGEHYESLEQLNDEFFGKIVDDGFDDYGKRVVDKSNNPAKHVGKNKKRNGGKKSAVVEHQKYPPHKH